MERGTTNQISVSRSYSLELVGGAGALKDKIDDYLFQDQKLALYVKGGLWGVFRVFLTGFDAIYKLNHLINNIEFAKPSSDLKYKSITNLQNI